MCAGTCLELKTAQPKAHKGDYGHISGFKMPEFPPLTNWIEIGGNTANKGYPTISVGSSACIVFMYVLLDSMTSGVEYRNV